MRDLLDRLDGVTKTTKGWQARCPAHDDRTASLSVSTGDDGRWLLYCHAECDPDAILAKLNLEWGDLFPENGNRRGTGGRRIVSTYDYRDADGTLRYQSVRYEPKDFRQRRPDGKGDWIWNLHGVERVLYRLPELQGQAHAVIVEGERDVDRLLAEGIPATTSGNAGSWKPRHTDQLQDAGPQSVVVIADNDDPGRKHLRKVAKSCDQAGLGVRVIEHLPDVPAKGDVSDSLDAHSVEDLQRLIDGAAAYQPAMAEAVSPKPATNSWPQPLRNTAYHGPLGQFVRVVEPHTEADPAAVLVQALAMFGNLIGRQPYFSIEADRHHTNVYACVVGRTAKARKGTGRAYAAKLLRGVDEHWTENCTTTGLSSGEGLIWKVRNQIKKLHPVREKGHVGYEEVIEDHGIEDKRLLVTESEFARVLQVIRREGNTLSAITREAWDTGNLNALTKNSPATATNAHISIVAHITEVELKRLLTATEVGNGFGNRFLFVCSQRSKLLPLGGGYPEDKIPPIVHALKEAAKCATRTEAMVLSPDAKALWVREYPRLSAEYDGMVGAMTSRSESQVLRLMCLYALADLSHVVEVIHLQAALEVWRYCFESARYLFGEATGDTSLDKLREALQKAGTEGLTRTEIHDVFSRNDSVETVDERLRQLVAAGYARAEKDDSGPTKSTERWYYTEPTAGEDERNEKYELSPRAESAEGNSSLNSLHSSADEVVL